MKMVILRILKGLQKNAGGGEGLLPERLSGGGGQPDFASSRDEISPGESRGMIKRPNPIAEKNTESRPQNICGHSAETYFTE